MIYKSTVAIPQTKYSSILLNIMVGDYDWVVLVVPYTVVAAILFVLDKVFATFK